MQLVHDLMLGSMPGHIQRQFVRDDEQDVFGRDTGVGDVNDLDRIGHLELQHPAQHGLAAAYFANHLDDALTAMNRVNQRVENITAFTSFEEQAGVGGDFERGTFEAEIFFVHGYSTSSRRSMRP